MNPIVKVMKAAGYLQGWIAAQNLPQSVISVINTLIEAAEKPVTQYRQEITLEDDEIERIANLVAQRIIDTQQTAYWPTEPVSEEEQEKEQPDTPDKDSDNKIIDDDAHIIAAIEKGELSERVPDHSGKKMCYRCWHLSPSVPGKKYQQCAKYGIFVRAITAERICNAFEVSDRIKVPPLKCISCGNYDKPAKYCDRLKLDIEKPNRDMYGVCPYWKSRFNEPLKFNSTDQETIRQIDENCMAFQRTGDT